MAVPRTVTVVLQIEDEKAASAIWDAHMSGALLNGCKVESVGNGDAFDHISAAEKLLPPKKLKQFWHDVQMLNGARVDRLKRLMEAKEAQCQSQAENEKKNTP